MDERTVTDVRLVTDISLFKDKTDTSVSSQSSCFLRSCKYTLVLQPGTSVQLALTGTYEIIHVADAAVRMLSARAPSLPGRRRLKAPNQRRATGAEMAPR